MVQLEQRLRESELQVHGAVLGRGAPYGDVCLLRLQVRVADIGAHVDHGSVGVDWGC